MQKEKRSNLAIYTLAGSILLSSVIVSMNPANSASSNSQLEMRIKALENKVSKLQNDIGVESIYDAVGTPQSAIRVRVTCLVKNMTTLKNFYSYSISSAPYLTDCQ